MFLDLGVVEIAADRAQRGEGAFLVHAQEPRITGQVYGQYCCQTSLGPLLAHLDCRSRREICDLFGMTELNPRRASVQRWNQTVRLPAL